MVQIVCACKRLVEVRDKQVVEHEGEGGLRCPSSGMRYVSKKVCGGRPGQPRLEVVAVGPVECPSCGETGLGALVEVSYPDPNLN